MKIVSFGYKHGDYPAQNVIDCRTLPNPFKHPTLGPRDGRDPEVQDYVMCTAALAKLEDALFQAEKLGRSVAFGCMGGRHRSVAMAELLSRRLKARGIEHEVFHRDLNAHG